MNKYFWNVEEMEESEEKQICLREMRFLESKYRAYMKFMLFIVTFYECENPLRQGKLNAETYPVKLYMPPFVPDLCVIFVHAIHTYTMMLTLSVIDTLMFTVAGLMEIQYKMLRSKLTIALDDSAVTSEKDRYSVLSRCNDHMTYLTQ